MAINQNQIQSHEKYSNKKGGDEVEVLGKRWLDKDHAKSLQVGQDKSVLKHCGRRGDMVFTAMVPLIVNWSC